MRQSLLAGLTVGVCGSVAEAASLTLRWADNSDNENGFVVERSVDGEAYYEIANASENVTSYIDSAVVPGHVYMYRVRAYNDAGMSPFTNLASGSVDSESDSDVVGPTAPGSLQGTATQEGKVLLSWGASEDNVGVSHYRVFRGGVSLGDVQELNYLDGAVVAGQSYNYHVVAYDGAGNASDASNNVVVQLGAKVDEDLYLGMGFEEESGDLVFDASAYKNDGSLRSGVTRSPNGKYGSALDFSGEGGSVDLGVLPIPSDYLTIACWIRPDDFEMDEGRIVSQASGTAGSKHYWMLSTVSSNGIKPRFRLKTSNGDTSTLIGASEIKAGVWTHLAATYDGAEMRLYVNGQPAGSMAKTGSVVQGTAPTAVGDQPQGGRGFDGLIDDLRVYLRALDAPELTEAMNGPVATVGAPDVEAPAAPESLEAVTVSESQVQLMWSPAVDNVGVLGYVVYRDGVELGTVGDPGYFDNALGTATEYAYTVSAFDEAGNESPLSSELMVQLPVADQPPSVPGGVKASAVSETEILVSWTPSTDDLGVSSYIVFEDGIEITTTTATEFSARALSPATTYRYAVCAVDTGGNRSALSGEVSATTLERPDGVVLEEELWLALGFEEGSGEIARDSSIYGNHGALEGGARFNKHGKIGKSVAFYGQNGGRVDLGGLDIPAEELTLFLWFRADDFNSDEGRLISKASGTGSDQHFWMLSTIADSGRVFPRFRLKTEGQTTSTLIGDIQLEAGKWTHLAATYDGELMRLYVDGALAGSLPQSGLPAVDSSVPVAIGDQPQGGRHFDGKIDEVKIYIKALDALEIQAEMGKPAP